MGAVVSVSDTLLPPQVDVEPLQDPRPGTGSALIPAVAAAAAFAILFFTPARTLVRDWWTDPEAGHGLLLAPLAIILAWKRGFAAPRPRPGLGLALLAGAVVLRWLSAAAAEFFTMNVSMLVAVVALIVYYRGTKQVVRWWLPLTLLLLSIRLPAVVLGTLALPLQLQASEIGAALLRSRHVPVSLSGNVLQLPGQTLFVTEACSGLRSLTALLALGVLVGGLWLRSPLSRLLLVALALPVAVLLNGIRVFLTGFLVYYVDPSVGQGAMHLTEGWAIFAVAFLLLGGIAWLLTRVESFFGRISVVRGA